MFRKNSFIRIPNTVLNDNNLTSSAKLLLGVIISFSNNEYKSAFALCDKDHDGKLSAQEMGNIMRTLGKNFSNQELNSIIQEIEIKGKGFIELDKFIELIF